MKGLRPTAAYIDPAALVSNFELARRLAGGREVIAVVKADAYGHGAVRVARRLAVAGCRRFAVMTAAEGGALRAAELRGSILVLGGVHDAAEAADAAALDLTPVVHHSGHLSLLRQAAREAGRPLAVHLEVDTGMARMGVSPEDGPAFMARLAEERALQLEGVYTHLACADEPDLEPTRAQLRLFAEILAAARSRGVRPPCVHVANSGALLRSAALEAELPAEVNAVRPGLMLYGAAPAPDLPEAAALRPVMHLRTRVAGVRWVRPGESVGYGQSWRATRRGRIATLPVGYADGIPWSLGGCGVALLRGQRVPYAGRVSMDLVTLDVGEAPVEIGDPVVLFGSSEAGECRLPVEELAALAGTLPYELLVRVGSRVPRVETR